MILTEFHKNIKSFSLQGDA